MIRLRPIRNLWFKFVQGTHLENEITAEEIAACLQEQRLITTVQNKSGDVRYKEQEELQEFMHKEILLFLEQYLSDTKGNGGTYERKK